MKTLLTVTLTLTLTFYTFAAVASAPQVKTQAPGYYRMMLGNIEVTVLWDGFFPMKPKDMLTPMPKGKLDELLTNSYQGEVIPTSVNSFLINTGAKLILVDAGCGAFFGPNYGHLLENLKASGYTPDQVDEIEITHMHGDHLGGIVKDGKAVFPHATVRVDQHDADFWLNLENAKTSNKMMNDMVTWAIAAVAPYKASNHFKPFEGKTEIGPGITALPSYGHTPGHTAYLIESQGKKLVLVGDLFHIEAVQFPRPSTSMIFDADQKAAAIQREKFFKEAAKNGQLLGAAHLPFPGIGHVLAEKSGFRYLPIPYGPLTAPTEPK